MQVTTSWQSPADEARVARVAQALETNGIATIRAASAGEAKRAVLELIPPGSSVHQGASRTLEIAGITEAINASRRYDALRPRLRSMDRQTDSDEIRRLMSTPDVMLGSVHAVTEDGSLVAASGTGSQLAPYAYGAGRVILVVGTHKIVRDLDEAIRRIYEYVLPLEDARAFEVYGFHSAVNKTLIINRERPGRITAVLVDEALGF